VKILLIILITVMVLAVQGIAISALPLAPLRIERTNDLCWIDEHSQCLPVDYTLLAVLQRPDVGVVIQYSADLVDWYFLDYFSPSPVEQEAWVLWLTPVAQRQPALHFRALDAEAQVNFLAPFIRPPGAFAYQRGLGKVPPQRLAPCIHH